ncbi:MAG: AsmA family protein [Nitrosomonadales bacterium]|nr:AsmA family protein [Nitrosomonadales bacterium]
MDNKTVFVRTVKGEDEMENRASRLSVDVKRALLMVDERSTFGEIYKRAAPSMRASLSEMFLELEKGGFIQDKALNEKGHKTSELPKMSVPSHMVVPAKTPSPPKPPVDNGEELDFMSGFSATPSAGKSAGEDHAAKLRAEADERARREIEAEKIKAQREAEAILHKAEQEANRIREETARRAREEAEAARLKAELQAKKAREELEAARLKAEQEAKQRLEAAAKERQRAEAARLAAEQEAKRVREELEAVRLKSEHEAKQRFEAATTERQRAEAARSAAEQEAKQRLEAAAKERQQAEAARVKAEQETKRMREELDAAKLKAEQEARSHQESAATAQAASAVKPGGFAFGAFQVDEAVAEQDKSQQPSPQSVHEEIAASTKKQSFAFGSFEVGQSLDEQVTPVPQPGEVARTAEEISPPVKPQATAPVEPSSNEQEQLKRQEQERIAAEAAQAKELANAQAKVWAEAEQRALDVAKANMERLVQQAEHPSEEYKEIVKLIPSLRPKRKIFTWGRLAGVMIFLVVLSVIALFAAPYVLPMRDYMPKVQKMLSAQLQQPVHIGHLSGRFLPTPRLELGEIYIGDAKQFQAEQAYLNFALGGLLGDVKPISSIDLQGVKVKGASLQNASLWLQQLAADKQYPVARMSISKGAVDADAFELSGIEGDLNFDPSGKFTKANLRANGGKYLLGLSAAPENKLQVAFSVRDGTLPLLPNWPFDDLSAKGMLSGDGMQISDFDSRIHGGVLQGSVTIDWRSGWHAQGDLSAKTITMQKLDKLLDGNVDGSARFKMAAANLADLADSVVLDGSFTSRDGVISGLDIVETARLQSKENLPGGRTHFDTLTGVIAYANNTYHFKQVKVVSSALKASANFDVAKQQLTGKMSVGLSLHDESAPAELKLGGVIDNPTLRSER